MKLILPAVFSVDEMRAANRIRHIAEPAALVEGTLARFARDRIEGFLFTAAGDGVETVIIPRSKHVPASISRSVVGDVDPDKPSVDLSEGKWLRHPILTVATGRPFDYVENLGNIRTSWAATFSYVQEDVARNIKGLRVPQIGATHAVHAHCSVSGDPATVVMPTGTGKTEVMLSVLVSAQLTKVLVLVPTDPLRTQIAEKFLTLGVLRQPEFTMLHERARRPIVGVLQHIPSDLAEVDDVFGRCNVIVTTSSIAGQCSAAVQERVAAHCSHLFIDEAHHAEAPTWSAFKKAFKDRRVLQFTATPFREDASLSTARSSSRTLFEKHKRRNTSNRFGSVEWWSSTKGVLTKQLRGRRLSNSALTPTRGTSSWLAPRTSSGQSKFLQSMLAIPNSIPFNFTLGSHPRSNGLRIEGASSARNHASSSAWTCWGRDLTFPNSKLPPFTTSGKRSR